MRNIEATNVETKNDLKEPYNPFDNLFFWLRLAYMDFSIGFQDTNDGCKQ